MLGKEPEEVAVEAPWSRSRPSAAVALLLVPGGQVADRVWGQAGLVRPGRPGLCRGSRCVPTPILLFWWVPGVPRVPGPIRPWEPAAFLSSRVEPLRGVPRVPGVPEEPISSPLEPLEPLRSAPGVPEGTSEKSMVFQWLRVAEPRNPWNPQIEQCLTFLTSSVSRQPWRRDCQPAQGFTCHRFPPRGLPLKCDRGAFVADSR